jgi:hypothetical protein
VPEVIGIDNLAAADPMAGLRQVSGNIDRLRADFANIPTPYPDGPADETASQLMQLSRQTDEIVEAVNAELLRVAEGKRKQLITTNNVLERTNDGLAPLVRNSFESPGGRHG